MNHYQNIPTDDPYNILLISGQPEIPEGYQKHLKKVSKKYNIQMYNVPSFKHIFNEVFHIPFKGIILDYNTKVKSSETEKDLMNDVLAHFPALLFNLNRQDGSVWTFPVGRILGNPQCLEEFITEECNPFPHQKIRFTSRKDGHYCVAISTTPDMEFIEKSVTYNISIGGCFLFSSTSYEPNQKLWLRFDFLKDSTPIECRVRWKNAWGEVDLVPGLGLQFTKIKENQERELSILLHGVNRRQFRI